MVDNYGTIIVGDVSPSKLAKTRMAQSVLDADWGMVKTMLQYKCTHAGIIFKEVNEANTARTCSAYDSLPGPKGVNGLRIREWACCECGVTHDHDINAARNILVLGHERPSVRIPVF
ncbi:zinc ribbon domain-containing protein [Pseudomonas luteola]|uniref:zinc ribbon domain-containing protein n=1 Tax=Pseudomonas luteola TaxID=47886 RepID=UPI0021ADEE3D|nr:zinc ribbon domain-containing protein [Pseudomonas luteola]